MVSSFFRQLSWNKKILPEPEMVLVQEGSFGMGSDLKDEGPVHKVQLDAFLIGRYPVTQDLWVAVTGSNPSSFKSYKDLPVESVSWNDVQLFLARLNKITGKNYRLPSEAEWEYAARGGARSGNQLFSGSSVADEVAWHENNSNKKTHPVGQLRANELGIYDLSGNIWEWCSDWYDDEYRTDEKFRRNPQGPDFGTFRVLRGGSWNAPASKCTVTSRFSYSGEFKNNCVGFRLAHSV